MGHVWDKWDHMWDRQERLIKVVIVPPVDGVQGWFL